MCTNILRTNVAPEKCRERKSTVRFAVVEDGFQSYDRATRNDGTDCVVLRAVGANLRVSSVSGKQYQSLEFINIPCCMATVTNNLRQ